MTVNEAIEQLLELQAEGYGGAQLRCYDELSTDVYPTIYFDLHLAEENYGAYNESFGTWVEVV